MDRTQHCPVKSILLVTKWKLCAASVRILLAAFELVHAPSCGRQYEYIGPATLSHVINVRMLSNLPEDRNIAYVTYLFVT
jgi:hypothetical protein